jgi:hypothetical protein
MFTQVEVDVWKERMKAITERLSRPQSLTRHQLDSLKAELDTIEQLVRKAAQS